MARARPAAMARAVWVEKAATQQTPSPPARKQQGGKGEQMPWRAKEAQHAQAQQDAIAAVAVRKNTRVPTKVTAGDWMCPSCSDHQFARNTKCRLCGTPYPSDRKAEGNPHCKVPSSPKRKEDTKTRSLRIKSSEAKANNAHHVDSSRKEEEQAESLAVACNSIKVDVQDPNKEEQEERVARACNDVAEACSLSCPSGHTLHTFTIDLPGVCGLCNDVPSAGSKMWGCRACDFDICLQCQQSNLDHITGSISGGVHDGNSTASTGTPRQDGDVTWSDVDGVWWPQDVAWSWDWHETETAPDFEGYQLCGDETLEHEGELYDIFYPGDSPHEEVSSGSGESRSDASDAGHVGSDQQSDIDMVHLQTSAEAGILSILAFMRGVAAVSYPARSLLFETVHGAAAMVLGEHFERFALVGSTALRIDTPDSDLDAVVFTRSCIAPSGEELLPPSAASVLRQVANTLCSCDPSLRLQLVDCTRVPVLTVFTSDGALSLDLTVDQPLSEWHVLWVQSQRRGPVFDSPLMQGVPVPTLDGWEQGLEAAALRCIKWWLRRRRIPVSKEGGYPTVVWTLMVIHALRCSVFYNEADGNDTRTTVDERTLLGAIAAFFDRFSEGGLAGTLLFAEGKHAEFWPQQPPSDCARQLPALSSGAFSVLDPTTTSEDSAAFGIQPLELAPRISLATQLLHAYELRRAQQLSSLALMGEYLSPSSGESGIALNALFAEDEDVCLLPAVVPQDPVGVIFLQEGVLMFGILQCINLKHGWAAPFLHRHDMKSSLSVKVCDVDVDMHAAVSQGAMSSNLHWLPPADVVCMAPVLICDEAFHWQGQEAPVFRLHTETLERWCKMHTLLGNDVNPPNDVGQSKSPRKNRSARNKKHGKA